MPFQPSASTSRDGLRRLFRAAAGAVTVAVLGACGGGAEIVVIDPPPASCSQNDQKAWLHDYMDDWYFWYALNPNPSPDAFATVDEYFQALLYTGTDSNFPLADRWSYVTSREAYERFFDNGQTLGYGVLVAGLEVSGHPDWPLYVRYVEPNSPAAQAGVLRGDRILSVNGRTAAELIAANDYSGLSATATGQQATLVLSNTGGQRQVSLSSTVYTLAPVANASVLTTPGGRKLGYLVVKDMIEQMLSPANDAFAQFKAAGVQDLVIDLRYNGGGLVSSAAALASFPAAGSTAGQVYSSLLFNNRHAGSNSSYRFADYANGLNLTRVYVLTGARTCSASEQLINALRPFVQVVTIGDTTCGKPVGFTAQDGGCDSVWSPVTFESVNALNEGRYFDGFAATCPVPEDFGQALGASSEPLLAAAVEHADGLGCPPAVAAGSRTQPLGLSKARPRPGWLEPGERQGMLAR